MKTGRAKIGISQKIHIKNLRGCQWAPKLDSETRLLHLGNVEKPPHPKLFAQRAPEVSCTFFDEFSFCFLFASELLDDGLDCSDWKDSNEDFFVFGTFLPLTVIRVILRKNFFPFSFSFSSKFVWHVKINAIVVETTRKTQPEIITAGMASTSNCRPSSVKQILKHN